MEVGVRLIPFNHKMRLARRRLNLTQAALAEQIGVSQSLIGAIERWQLPTTKRGVERLEHIACILGIEVNDLFPEPLRNLPQAAFCSIETVIDVVSLDELAASERVQIEDTDVLLPDVAVMKDEMTAVIRNTIESLSAKQRRILSLRFGLDNNGPHSLDEVAWLYGVSRERIRQIEAGALRQLRHPSYSRVLREYITS